MRLVDHSVERPRYILNLDDLPKVIEADGTVYPIYLTARNVARLFGIDIQTVRAWAQRYEWPVLYVGSANYVPVQFVVDWIAANTRLFRESEMDSPVEGSA